VPDFRGLGITVVATRPVACVAAHLAGVLAQLDEVPARVFGLDRGFGG
jgi:hypothetical protein